MSETTKRALDVLGGYIVEERGLVEMKGKGEVLTFWLQGAGPNAIQVKFWGVMGMKFYDEYCIIISLVRIKL